MIRSIRPLAIFVAATTVMVAHSQRLPAEIRGPGLTGESAILGDDIKRDVTFLAADDKAGRKTAGGVLEGVVTEYLEAEFKRLKLEPAGVDGYRQPWRYRAWDEQELAGFAPRRVDHGDEDENHLHGYARMADGSFPADAFGSHCNEQGLAFSPDGQPVSIEDVDAIPTLAPAAPNTHNLVAKIRGRTKPDEYVVLGAHMDHIGTSMWGSGDKICNGADDNGSGTSTLLAIARGLAAARDAGQGPERSVVIIWFAGEELGLLGSQYFVSKPTIPLDKVKAMINVDMTGRLEPDKVSVCDRAPSGMANLLHELHDAEGLGFRSVEHNIEQYMTRSDQYSFYRKNIPVMFFFEGLTSSGGLNPDYHRVSDHADKIDGDKAARIGRLMFRHVMGVANHR